MTNFNDIKEPTECKFLVSLFDLSHFALFSQNQLDSDVFKMLSSYFEFVGDTIEPAGGMIVKYIGDAGLMVFPEYSVDSGVISLLELKKMGDQWMVDRNIPCHNVIKVHFGPVICGPMGTREDKRFDIIGDTVNTTFMLPSGGIAITPQVFRKLNSETRKRFKKHTPPITYIPIEQRHN